MTREPRPSEWATRGYRLLLRLYPKSHRQKFGAQMLRTFMDAHQDTADEGQAGLTFWLGVIGDEIGSITHEHLTMTPIPQIFPIIILLGGAEFATVSVLDPKHIPIPALAALAFLPILAIAVVVLLMITGIAKWAGNWRVVTTIIVAGLALSIVGIHETAKSVHTNTWCTSSHKATSRPPSQLVSAQDYFTQGDYDYDLGECDQAIVAYTQAIALDSGLAEAYNNRAYTYMMEQDYQSALSDLNTAIEIRPDYAHALMNRGDLYNYDLVDRPLAIVDYERLIALGPTATADTQVCGHLFYAEHNGWHLKTVWDLPRTQAKCEP